MIDICVMIILKKNMKAGHQNGASRAVKWQVITGEV